MNGVKTKTLWLGAMAAGLLSLAGCSSGACNTGCGANGCARQKCKYTYDDLVDPCYPQRYSYEARALVREPLETQAHNGLVLEHTLWNHHFEQGSDKLTKGGKMLIDRLMRRRPAPNPELYLQTAMDLTDEAAPKPEGLDAVSMMADETCAAKRKALNDARRKTIEKYVADCYPGQPVAVVYHNAYTPGMHTGEAARAIGAMNAGAGASVNSAAAERNKAANAGYAEKETIEKKETRTEDNNNGNGAGKDNGNGPKNPQ